MDKSLDTHLRLMQDLFEDSRKIMSEKNADYAKDNNMLDNFETIATLLDKSELEVLAVYFMKHVFAILTYCKQGKVTSEPIEGRIKDAINYLCILNTLIQAEKNNTLKTPV